MSYIGSSTAYGKVAIAVAFVLHYLLVMIAWVEVLWSPLSLSSSNLALLTIYAFSALSFLTGFGGGYIFYHRHVDALSKSESTPYIEGTSAN